MPEPRTSRVRLFVKPTCLALSASLASGCMTWRPIPPGEDALHEALHAGASLRIATRGGEVDELRVTAVAGDRILGKRPGPARPTPYYVPPGIVSAAVDRPDEDVTVPLSDVARVDERRFSASRTVLLAVGITGAIVALYAYALTHPEIDLYRDPPPGSR